MDRPRGWSSADLPAPKPGPGEVVIAVRAAALNFFDTLIIENRYQTKPALPFSPSAECAGTIAAIGEGVTGWRIGERVAAWLGFGAAREQVVVPAELRSCACRTRSTTRRRPVCSSPTARPCTG